MRKFIGLLFMFFCLNVIWAEKNSIVIEYLSSEQQELELKEISTIKFEDNFVKFVDFSGIVIAEREVSDIRKISFTKFTKIETATENVSDIVMIAYPNPTMDALYVQGLEIGDVVRIYSLDGALLKMVTIENEIQAIMVGSLANGAYLLQSNTNIVKFIKK